MKKFHFYISLLAFSMLCSIRLSAQNTQHSSDSSYFMNEINSLKGDSLLAELKGMFDSLNSPKSFFSASASLSNKLFSANNNALNSQQSNTKVLAFIPSISYYHKSGLGATFTSYMRNIDGNFKLYQSALTPSYDKIGKKIMYGVSYTHYFKNQNNTTATNTTPYNNDFYAYVQGRRKWLRPSMAVGFAGGSYKDISVIPVRRNGNNFYISDTATVKINDITLIGGVSHSFNFSNIFSDGDGISVIPQLSLTGGRQAFTTIHHVPLQGIVDRQVEVDRLQKMIRSSLSSSSSSSKVSIQSAGLSTNVSYMKSVFAFSVGYYIGYYFNSAASNNLVHIVNMNLSVTF